jgi:hypothetical protein
MSACPYLFAAYALSFLQLKKMQVNSRSFASLESHSLALRYWVRLCLIAPIFGHPISTNEDHLYFSGSLVSHTHWS